MATRLGLFALGIGRQQGRLWPVVVRQTPSSRYIQFSTSSSSRSDSSSNPNPSPSPATPPGEPKKKSPHVGFYQVYGRALSKVLLMSLLVYQGLYYGWMYLEHLEVKHGKEGEIKALEQKIRDLQEEKKEQKAA
ncbi:hypothetical protein TWF225_008780 [Orbilia oligospora]|uniref:Uncharacterized protein n=1 Tax=Orbilia oligospora TaxID=2813651 RepID=A0A7C8TUE9_ORBOL|nr:hypothetical protein TWF225_008780 [Orbilia oligospora]KAF3181410.1 hypothetical protein TWF751_009353 [Orbilia oligospora]KAF3254577.1 hypothetical protein TWF217_006798 [Orbilia oligospora]KAF3259277.1 hypothetical protein TWF128_004353 [Orbilia oligospora]KAF3292444.1 hypothetical protein TWF132_005504 [Orbilia oligospora]